MRPGRAGGLSLIEVVLAMGVLAVASLSLLSVFVSGLKLMERSDEMAAANEIAKTVLETVKRDVRREGMTALPSGTFTYDGRAGDPPDTEDSSPFPPDPYPQTTMNGQTFQVMVHGEQQGPRLKLIQVSVFWGPNESLRLGTVFHP